VGPGGQTNVAVMNLVVPRQSSMAPEATSFALFLTNASNQLAFAREARVLPSSRAALKGLEQDLVVAVDDPSDPAAERQEALVRKARALSVRNLDQARVLVPATPGIKRLQAILYTQLQRAMLGQISSDAALAEAERQWNRYAEARWP
jgi:putative chitobiose transport system substrate-binding protein